MKLLKTFIAGIGAITSLLCLAMPAQAAGTWVSDPPRNGVICQVRTGGTYPEDDHVIYCGTDNLKRDALLTTILTTFTNFPIVKTQMASQGATFGQFTNVVDFAVYTSPSGLTLAQQQAAYNADQDTVGKSAPYKSFVFENKAHGTYPAYVAQTTGQSQAAILHEMGHEFDYGTSPFRSVNAQTVYYGNADQQFLTATAVSPTSAALRASYDYFIGWSTTPRWTEIFSEQVARIALQAGSPGTMGDVDTNALVPYFKCTKVYIKALMSHSGLVTKADFDAENTAGDPNVYGRCEQAYIPPGCVIVQSSGSYPYQYNGLETNLGWYVYCGTDPTRFQTRSGDILQSLSTTPAWRQKLQAAGIALYVFQDSAQAVSLLGAAAVPTTAQAAEVLGFTQTQILGNAETPFIAMFERVKQANGTYVEHPFTNDMYNYDSDLKRESGRGVDLVAGAIGSVNTTFKNRVVADIARFNLRDGCAVSGPDSNLWGSLKSTICNTTTHTKQGMYATLSNQAIVRGLTVAQLGSGVKFPPDYQALFPDTPSASNYSLIWAEMIAFYRGSSGNDFAGELNWLNTIYTCGYAYSVNGVYVTGAAPVTTCP